MGYLCYIFLALLGGGLGGFTYSLRTNESHQCRLPFYRKRDIETGCLGHIFIGALAGLLLLSLTISHLNFDVSKALDIDAHPLSATRPLGREGMLVIIHTLAITLIGGFLGLKLIIKVSDEAYKELDKKIGNLAGEVRENETEDVIYRHALFARALRGDGDLPGAERELKKSLEIRPTKFGEFVHALILRSKGQFQPALDALDRALKLPNDTFVKDDATIYWNKACYTGLLNPEKITEVMALLDLSLKINPKFKEDIKGDDDLKRFLDKPEFKTYYGL